MNTTIHKIMKYSQLSTSHFQEFNYHRSRQWLISPPGIELDYGAMSEYCAKTIGGFWVVCFTFEYKFQVVKISEKVTAFELISLN